MCIMKMEREKKRNGFCVDKRDDDVDVPKRDTTSPSSSWSAHNYIQHHVSKLDTLAGVAIKYGVEVADIKKMNGLVTDLQMFALKSLHIPLPGRHPPSPCLSNGSYNPGESSSEMTPPHHPANHDLLDSFQSLKINSCRRKISSVMSLSSLQGYYGLESADQKFQSDGFEMASYRKETSHYLDTPIHRPSPLSNPPLSHHRKTKSLANGFLDENGELKDISAAEIREADSDKWNEKVVRRRQKSDYDFNSLNLKKMTTEENSVNRVFSTIFGKQLASRPKAVSRNAATIDTETGGMNPIPIGLGDSVVADVFAGVRKSSSTPSLQDQASISSSIWSSSKWNLKPDLQALSNSSIARPFIESLPKPKLNRRNKAALD